MSAFDWLGRPWCNVVRIGVCVTGLALGSAGCGSIPKPTPMRDVRSAPPELAELRIHVRGATFNRSNDLNENVTGYTVYARGAVQQAMLAAGYHVVVDPAQTYDLLLRIDTDSQGDYPGGQLVTSLEFSTPDGQVELLSGRIRLVGADLIPDDAAEIVESFAASRRLREFAASAERPCVPCQTTQAPTIVVGPDF